jgi:hypothetical protein
MGQPLAADIVESMKDLSNTLIEKRKKIKAPSDYISKNDLGRFKQIESLSNTFG